MNQSSPILPNSFYYYFFIHMYRFEEFLEILETKTCKPIFIGSKDCFYLLLNYQFEHFS